MDAIDIRDIITRTVAEVRNQEAVLKDLREEIVHLRKKNVELLEKLANLK